MRRFIAALALLVAIAPSARAADQPPPGVSETERADRWDMLRLAVFGNRVVHPASGVIVLEAPGRALDAALVPIGIILPDPIRVKSVSLLIDANPSPLAGVFHFGPAADMHSLHTRVRVDSYTLIHAVAETQGGELYAAETYVKAAGGCSAPGATDREAALARLGRMKLRVTQDAAAPGTATAQLLISHPNANGMQMDPATRGYIPARFIQDIDVRTAGALVFHLDGDISLSEDPAFTFGFVTRGADRIDVVVHDSANTTFQQSFDVAPAS